MKEYQKLIGMIIISISIIISGILISRSIDNMGLHIQSGLYDMGELLR